MEVGLQTTDLNVLPTFAYVGGNPCTVTPSPGVWIPPAVTTPPNLVESAGLTTFEGKIYDANGVVSEVVFCIFVSILIRLGTCVL